MPGYGPDVQKNREEARAIMKKLGYGPDKRLPLKVSTRGISLYKDPAVIFAEPAQGDLDRRRGRHHRDLAVVRQVARKDYSVGLNTTGNGVDDPDQNYFENFACKSERNYTGYCNPEIEKLFEVQSAETDFDKRKQDRLGNRPQAAGGRRAARSSCGTARRPACSPTSRATCRRSTASTTASASRMSGSTSRRLSLA